MMKRNFGIAIILISCFCISFISCNTFGGLDGSVMFHTNSDTLTRAMDSLYAKYPEYKLPAKWKAYDNLSLKPTPGITNTIIYFKDAPEEMYYVSLINDSLLSGSRHRNGLAIRAVNQGNANWLQAEDIGFREEKRIQKRFRHEIIAKLKVYIKGKSSVDD
jgi:hypothetical protein